MNFVDLSISQRAIDWTSRSTEFLPAQEKRAMKTARLQLSPLIVAIGGTTRPKFIDRVCAWCRS
jgi:hypothetical protein